MLFSINESKHKFANVTCALAICVPSNKFLIVHATGGGFMGGWSFPKGLRDDGEMDCEAAVREVFEETSLDLRGYKLKDYGVFDYTREKKYHLFSTKYNSEIDVKSLKCTSTFVNTLNEDIVEVDDFMLATPEDCLKFLNKKQSAIFQTIIEFKNDH